MLFGNKKVESICLRASQIKQASSSGVAIQIIYPSSRGLKAVLLLLASTKKYILSFLLCCLMATPSFAHFLIADHVHHDLVKEALDCYNEGDLNQALSITKEIPNKTHRDSITWLVLMEVNDNNSLIDLIKFYETKTDWPFVSVTRRKIEQSFNEKSDPDVVLGWFNKYPPMTGKGQKVYLKYLINHDSSNKAKIAELIREIWKDSNFTETEERIFEQKYHQYLTADDHYMRIDNLIWQKQYSEARKLSRHLDSGRAYLVNARLAFLEDKTGKELLLKLVPSKYMSDEGLLFSIMLRSSEDDNHAAFSKYLTKTGNIEDMSYVDRWCGLVNMEVRSLLENSYYQDAYRLSLKSCAFNKAKAADSQWLSGWIALRSLNDPALAIEHFLKQFEIVKMPISRSRAAYWLGRSYQELGSEDEATKYYHIAAEYPFTFYGLHAAEELGNKSIKGMFANKLPKFPDNELAQLGNNRNMNIAYIVSQSRWYDLAHSLINQELAKADSTYSKHLIVAAGKKFGRPDIALVAAKGAMYHNIVDYEAAFPYMKEDFMNKPVLVNALTRQESLFNKNAVSSAGAMGLMQLMPKTALLTARQLGVTYEEKKLTRDGKYNLRLGSHHIDYLHNGFKSNIMAIASYNAGDTPIKKWVSRFGDPRKFQSTHEIIDWIEQIPYCETRNYVQRVIENMQIYRSVIHGKSDLEVSISTDLKN